MAQVNRAPDVNPLAKYEEFLRAPDGVQTLLARLEKDHPICANTKHKPNRSDYDVWDACGNTYRVNQRFHDAIAVHSRLYDLLCKSPGARPGTDERARSLVWLSECYWQMGWVSLSQRFLMLTLVEEAIASKGQLFAEGGTYWRARRLGMSRADVVSSYELAHAYYQEDRRNPQFAEWALQQLPQTWRTKWPSTDEALQYVISVPYAQFLFARLSDRNLPTTEIGNRLEHLAQYLMSAIPGCRAQKARSHSTDYDLVCVLEGAPDDFRRDIGRYFFCECKNWDKAANFTTMAKFGQVLKSAGRNFGILFSSKGISGAEDTTNAAREKLKLNQQGVVVIVLDDADLSNVVNGTNLVTMIREKYEVELLDLKAPLAPVPPSQPRQAGKAKSLEKASRQQHRPRAKSK